MELRNDGVQCAMHQSTWRGFRDVSEIRGKVSETSERLQRHIGDTSEHGAGHTLTVSEAFPHTLMHCTLNPVIAQFHTAPRTRATLVCLFVIGACVVVVCLFVQL